MYEALPEHSGDRYTGIFTLALSFRKSAELAQHDITEAQVVSFIREIDQGYHDSQGGDRIKKQVSNAFNA